MTISSDLPLVVYRGWQVGEYKDTFRLYGQYKALAEWTRGDVTATCTDCGVNTPQPHCGCGLHGYVQMPPVWSYAGQDNRTKHISESFHYYPHIIFGAALLWGRTLIGTQTGVARGQYGCVLALLNMGDQARKAAEYYGVPTVPSSTLLRSYALEYGHEEEIPTTP